MTALEIRQSLDIIEHELLQEGVTEFFQKLKRFKQLAKVRKNNNQEESLNSIVELIQEFPIEDKQEIVLALFHLDEYSDEFKSDAHHKHHTHTRHATIKALIYFVLIVLAFADMGHILKGAGYTIYGFMKLYAIDKIALFGWTAADLITALFGEKKEVKLYNKAESFLFKFLPNSIAHNMKHDILDHVADEFRESGDKPKNEDLVGSLSEAELDLIISNLFKKALVYIKQEDDEN